MLIFVKFYMRGKQGQVPEGTVLKTDAWKHEVKRKEWMKNEKGGMNEEIYIIL